MNFFAEQQRARRRSFIAVVLFLLATAIVVALTTGAVLITVAVAMTGDERGESLVWSGWSAVDPGLPWLVAAAVAGVVGCASLYRMATLAAGGAAVAAALGGEHLGWDRTGEPQRQLLNVVEEMAIACGIPAPDVYLLPGEGGINAFAAGYGTGDAVVGVTRGALESLDRDELQGVVAHEFGHIMNGDMRLNTRLVGLMFGIQVIAIAGRTMLESQGRSRSSGSSGRGAAGLLLLGVALLAIGYAGVVCARLIKAAVSREREYLADASAVQFTRNPLGIAGALKKIAAFPLRATILSARGEEISHMLIAEREWHFGDWFSSHPPILARIRALDPAFRESELASIRLPPMNHDKPAPPPQPQPHAEARSAAGLVPLMVVGSIGTVGEESLRIARRRRDAIDPQLRATARSVPGALQVAAALLLAADAATRERQLARLATALGLDAAGSAELAALAPAVRALEAESRRPLLESAFPALRHAPRESLRGLHDAIDAVVALDRELSVVDFALARLLRVTLRASLQPQAGGQRGGGTKLHALRGHAIVLFAVVARNGHADEGGARAAFLAGTQQLFPRETLQFNAPADWREPLDAALDALDGLAPFMKEALIGALETTVRHDRQLTLGELELLRAICASLHCPVPLL